jgi:hypothetical protein
MDPPIGEIKIPIDPTVISTGIAVTPVIPGGYPIGKTGDPVETGTRVGAGVGTVTREADLQAHIRTGTEGNHPEVRPDILRMAWAKSTVFRI